MKSIIIAAVVFAGGIWAADEAADRVGIENTISAFSVMPERAGLYTSDFDHTELVGFGKAPATDGGAIPIRIAGVDGTLVISKEPMGEAIWLPAAKLGNIIVKKIRFLTPDVAVVDAMEKSSVLFVMKKEGTDWKIASLRRLAEN